VTCKNRVGELRIESYVSRFTGELALNRFLTEFIAEIHELRRR